ncbi:MAG: molybdopterin cofactor-binding domain-containing protein, partial [Tistlia sp.]
LAATRLRDRMARLASQKLNAEPEQLVFEGGRIFARGNPDNAAAFYRVAGSLHWSPGSLPEGMPPSLRETAHWSPPELAPPTEADEINTSLTYGFVFDFCGVEIDRSTGRLTIDRYVTMHDAGRLLHPAIAEGQIVGSYVQALGASLYEDYAYGSDGSLLAGTFADYLLPTAPEVRDPLVLHLETPSPFTRLGAKGLGEGNNMSTPVCIANAVADALDLAEVRLPITEDRINAWLSGAEPPRPERPGAAARATPERRARPAALSGRNSYLIAADRAAVWKRLLDPDALAAVIPGCRRFEQQGERRYLAEAVVRVGPIRGAFTARLELCDLEEPESLRILGEAQGALGAARGEGRLLLVEEGAGTRIDYQYDIDLSGKISSVGSRLLEGASGLLIRQFLAGFARQLETAEGPGAAPAGRSPWRRLLARLGLGR